MVRLLAIQLLIGIQRVFSEPLTVVSKEVYINLDTRAPNWTTQAWQTKCNNIDYYGDNDDCCTFVSGPKWKNCNGVGWAEVSRSEVLCYSLTEGHDCCEDNSVCDTNLGCCDGTCCQTDTSITVCEDGCISEKGNGCTDGTCAHGENNRSTLIETEPDSVSPTGSGDAGPSTREYDDPINTGDSEGESSSDSSSSPSSSSPGGSGGDMGRTDKIALAISLAVGIPTAIAAVWQIFRWCRGRP